MNKRLGVRRGFTLVEITLIVGILVVLSAIVLVALNIRGNTAAANNVKRKIDLESIQKALDLRAQETGDPLPENLPAKATCIGNGGSDTFDLQSVNWTEAAPSMDADIRFDAHSCDDENCSGDSWPGLNFSDPAAANSLAGISDTPYFQYQAEFKDYKYPSEVAVEEKLIHPTCAGYTIGVDCYTSLAAWEDAADGTGSRNLVTEGKIAVAKIIGDWTSYTDIATVLISGWTTDATHYIRIYTAPEARHSGKWDNSKYKLVVSNNHGINISEDFVRIDGLQIQLSSSVTDRGGIWVSSANGGSEILISSNLIKGSLSGTINSWGIIPTLQSAPNNRLIKIWNNMIYDFRSSGGLQFGIDIRGGWTAYVYNNTVYDNRTGIRRYDTDAPLVIAKNNISYNNNDNYNGVFDSNSTNNLSGPGSDAEIPLNGARNGVNVAFIDETVDDFRLASSDAGAKNNGADLSTDTNLASNTDIEKQLRPAALWDIGADEAGALASDFMLKDITIGLNINSAGSPYTFLDTVYNDFIKGTAPSPLVISGSSNPNDADSGAITYVGGSGSVAYTSQVFSSLCYDLSNDLADYLGTIPKDPKTGTDQNTGYLISVDPATKVVCVKAPGAENDEIIENCRK